MSRIAFGGISVIILILTICLFPEVAISGDSGICLPSPNNWKIPHFAGWLIGIALILLSAFLIASANKKYNFIPEAQPILPLSLLILVACNPLTSSHLSTSTLLLFCNVLCFFIIISTYEERNATREFFIIATLPAIGAMVQYAFLVMVPVYLGAGLLMKSFRLREFIAFLLGLITPYWIGVGLGLISPFAFKLPDTLIIIGKGTVENDIFLSLISAGIMVVAGFIFSLYNGVKLFSRNSRLRCIHMSFNLMGYVTIAAIIFDFTNFAAYYSTLCLWTAIQLATFLHFYNIRRPQLALIVLLALFLTLYILGI